MPYLKGITLFDPAAVKNRSPDLVKSWYCSHHYQMPYLSGVSLLTILVNRASIVLYFEMSQDNYPVI